MNRAIGVSLQEINEIIERLTVLEMHWDCLAASAYHRGVDFADYKQSNKKASDYETIKCTAREIKQTLQGERQ